MGKRKAGKKAKAKGKRVRVGAISFDDPQHSIICGRGQEAGLETSDPAATPIELADGTGAPVGVPNNADLVDKAVERLKQARVGLELLDDGGSEAEYFASASAVVYRLMQARWQIDEAIDRLV